MSSGKINLIQSLPVKRKGFLRWYMIFICIIPFFFVNYANKKLYVAQIAKLKQKIVARNKEVAVEEENDLEQNRGKLYLKLPPYLGIPPESLNSELVALRKKYNIMVGAVYSAVNNSFLLVGYANKKSDIYNAYLYMRKKINSLNIDCILPKEEIKALDPVALSKYDFNNLYKKITRSSSNGRMSALSRFRQYTRGGRRRSKNKNKKTKHKTIEKKIFCGFASYRFYLSSISPKVRYEKEVSKETKQYPRRSRRTRRRHRTASVLSQKDKRELTKKNKLILNMPKFSFVLSNKFNYSEKTLHYILGK